MKLIHELFYMRLVEKDDAVKILAYELKNRSAFQATNPTRSERFYTLEAQVESVQRTLDAQKAQYMARFLIFTPNHQLIGLCGLNEILLSPNLMSCFIGYSIDPSFQGKGLMTQAVKMVCEYGFRVLHLHRIEAGVMPSNIASQRVLEKNGFIREGLALKNVHINGQWEDHYTYGCLNPFEKEA